MTSPFFVKIENLPSITSQNVKILNSLNIYTNIDLLKQGFNQNQCIMLAHKTGVNIKEIKKWIALADLARIKGVGSQYCGLLLHAGVPSLATLKQAKAPLLHRQILRLQVATLKRRDLCPSISLIQQWIKEAQKIK